MSRPESAGATESGGSFTGFPEESHSLSRMLDEDHPLANRDVSLVDLLDRVLAKGVVITGDLTISIADVDLVRVSLRALVSSINEDVPSPWEHGHPLSGWVRQD
ncbi:gas vesicle protein GvpA/GvpJ/GvpM family [Murinocardiopsis flavida]|uniref:Gas vesicle protein GvpA/GvpJ/GvpM family n=2 Tax=Murinocardiopsis flavida TaxID=645275 RepID=A0A2P8DL70_9ACTN|nr:gas vesicle protein [Murinocardiopsis flavida]PSK97966.1 gas vesicle protein GvpA/GvpJ/GvpM family [Murinocardiopsis flavida]